MTLREIFAFLRACQCDPKKNRVKIYFTKGYVVCSKR